MLKPEQVPDEVISAYVHEITYGSEYVPGAIAAAINAWPGMSIESLNPFGETKYVVLPLENAADEIERLRAALLKTDRYLALGSVNMAQETIRAALEGK